LRDGFDAPAGLAAAPVPAADGLLPFSERPFRGRALPSDADRPPEVPESGAAADLARRSGEGSSGRALFLEAVLGVSAARESFAFFEMLRVFRAALLFSVDP